VTEALKRAVQAFWDAKPCGTVDVAEARAGTPDGFRALDDRRYVLEPCIEAFAAFERHAGRRVLEIGCGAGADLMRFARAGARVTGVDLSPVSLDLTRRRFEAFVLPADLRVADAENLPFPDATFDLVYSWGVLHHTPETARAVAEVFRVIVSGGSARIMLYHRRSIFALQAWMRHALLRGQPWHTVTDVLAAHVESPGTHAYSVAEAKELFCSTGFAHVHVRPVLTVWDARVGRRRFLPAWCRALLPDRFGWFLLVSAERPAA
jgi:SAM-dependent methyltransferase